MKVWIVGERMEAPDAWTLVGVFTTEEKAVAACTAWNHFVGPITVDEATYADVDWPDAYYPVGAA